MECKVCGTYGRSRQEAVAASLLPVPFRVVLNVENRAQNPQDQDPHNMSSCSRVGLLFWFVRVLLSSVLLNGVLELLRGSAEPAEAWSQCGDELDLHAAGSEHRLLLHLCCLGLL